MKGIDAPKLEKELAAMWGGDATGANADGSPQAGVTRACVLNLVVYSTVQDDRAAIDQLLEAVTEEHPCRALVLIADREASQPKLDAYVSTRCQISPKGGKQVCGEQVTIEAGGTIVDTVATAISPLLVPDVPVFLWWKDIPQSDDQLFDRMAAMSDRVVIDSAAFDNPHDDFLSLARVIREHGKFMRVSDIDWGRLTAWRTLVASFWDVPDYRPHLDQISRIDIEYSPSALKPEDVAAQAWLVVGWLASRLGWEVVAAKSEAEGGVVRVEMRAGERPIQIVMRRSEDGAESGGMISSLGLFDEAGGAEFHTERLAELKLKTRAKLADDEHEVGRVLAYEAKSEGRRLSRELGFLARDEVYERATAVVARALELLNEPS